MIEGLLFYKNEMIKGGDILNIVKRFNLLDSEELKGKRNVFDILDLLAKNELYVVNGMLTNNNGCFKINYEDRKLIEL